MCSILNVDSHSRSFDFHAIVQLFFWFFINYSTVASNYYAQWNVGVRLYQSPRVQILQIFFSSHVFPVGHERVCQSSVGERILLLHTLCAQLQFDQNPNFWRLLDADIGSKINSEESLRRQSSTIIRPWFRARTPPLNPGSAPAPHHSNRSDQTLHYLFVRSLMLFIHRCALGFLHVVCRLLLRTFNCA